MSTPTTHGERFRAGGTAACRQAWRSITQNKWVLDMISGASIELTQFPPRSPEPESASLSLKANVNKRKQLRHMLDTGLIEEAMRSDRTFVSHLFFKEKANGSFRPILNLSVLNEYIKYYHFKMEEVDVVVQALEKGDWLTSIDLKQAFHSIPICERDRDLLSFIFEGKLYRFKALPNGLSSAPRIFTKVLKAVSYHLASDYGLQVYFYIDDSAIVCGSYKDSIRATNLTVSLLQSLGFTSILKNPP